MKQSLPMLTLLAIMASPVVSAQQTANSAAEPAAATATAEPAATPETSATESEADLAIKAAEAVMQHGPAEIKVEQQAALALPEGFGYVPRQQAQRLLKAWGNGDDNSVEGLIFPTQGDQQNWFFSRKLGKNRLY